MGQRIFYLLQSKPKDGMTFFGFEKVLPSPTASKRPKVSYLKVVKTNYLLGTYTFDGIDIDLLLAPLYEEEEDSVSIRFNLNDGPLYTHALIRSDDKTGVAINREGEYRFLNQKLPDDFYIWLAEKADTLTM